MFTFPLTFREENEDYITLQPLKEFVKNNNIEGVNSNTRKSSIVSAIERFANNSIENEEKTNIWLDNAIKEGRKDVYMRYLDIDNETCVRLKNKEYVEELLKDVIPEKDKRHISKNRYGNNIKICKYEYINDDNGVRLVLYLCRMVLFINSKNQRSGQWYPIICELFIDKKLLITRVKPKTKIYDYPTNDEDVLISVKPETEAHNASEYVVDLLGVSFENNNNNDFRKKLYRMLRAYTQTPDKIVSQMNEMNDTINVISEKIRKDICNVDENYTDDIKQDVNNLVEKYISISKHDKSIFIKNKKAYPIKMVATDEEDSVLQQASALEKPLQSRAVFFDNKKMLQKNEMCDGIIFSFLECSSEERFLARITAYSATNCTMKFYDYEKEEDINAAIFTFINS